MDCVTKEMRKHDKWLLHPKPGTIETAILFMLSQFSLFYLLHLYTTQVLKNIKWAFCIGFLTFSEEKKKKKWLAKL